MLTKGYNNKIFTIATVVETNNFIIIISYIEHNDNSILLLYIYNYVNCPMLVYLGCYTLMLLYTHLCYSIIIYIYYSKRMCSHVMITLSY